jgi:poly(3-hydroxyalkanoate) synthetase
MDRPSKWGFRSRARVRWATFNHRSWRPDSAKWVADYVGEPVAARLPGCGALARIEDAPGSYVRTRVT